MKRFLLLLILLPICCVQLNARQYKIQYAHTVNFETGRTDAVYDLLIVNSKGLYVKVSQQFTEKQGNDVVSLNQDVTPFVLKDYAQKETYGNQPILNKIFYIKDLLPLQKWELLSESKQYQGFVCHKATTSFRGRNYTAWYTTDLPLMGGPWKFDGLPGLILEVASDDKVLTIQAVSIEKKDTATLRQGMTPFESHKKDVITWTEYCAKYKEALARMRKNMAADNDSDTTYEMKINSVEDLGF